VSAVRRLGFLAVLAAAAGVAGHFFLRPVAVTVATVTQRDLAPAIQGVRTVEAKVVVHVIGPGLVGSETGVPADQQWTLLRADAKALLDAAAASASRDPPSMADSL
jgi:hypothetical protein